MLPFWLSGIQALLYNSWYYAWIANINQEKFLSATFKVSDVSKTVDLKNMTGVEFIKPAIEWLNKQRMEKIMVPGHITR